jgi:thiol-disulfide isomerase/thioredoxin
MKNLLHFINYITMALLLTGCQLFQPASAIDPDTGFPMGTTSSSTASFELDDRLQRIKLSDLDGRPFTLEDLGGRPVFLNFWATWCGPCISEMRSIEEVYQQYKDDVVFLAVSTETPEQIKAFQAKHDYSFQFARLEVEYVDAFVVKLPTTMLITRDGKMQYEEEGFRVWTQYNNLEKIKEIAD